MKLRSSNWLVRPYSHIQSSALLLGLQLTALENIKIKQRVKLVRERCTAEKTVGEKVTEVCLKSLKPPPTSQPSVAENKVSDWMLGLCVCID